MGTALQSSHARDLEPAELPLGLYAHFKGGRYEVLSVATHSETDEKVAVYRRIGDEAIWVRPTRMFCESVRVGEALVPRFKFVGASADSERLSAANLFKRLHLAPKGFAFVRHAFKV